MHEIDKRRTTIANDNTNNDRKKPNFVEKNHTPKTKRLSENSIVLQTEQQINGIDYCRLEMLEVPSRSKQTEHIFAAVSKSILKIDFIQVSGWHSHVHVCCIKMKYISRIDCAHCLLGAVVVAFCFFVLLNLKATHQPTIKSNRECENSGILFYIVGIVLIVVCCYCIHCDDGGGGVNNDDDNDNKTTAAAAAKASLGPLQLGKYTTPYTHF